MTWFNPLNKWQTHWSVRQRCSSSESHLIHRWKEFQDAWNKFQAVTVEKRQAAANTCLMIVRVSGLVSGGGGKDAVQEWYTPEKWTLWDPEQHDSGQQLCTGQREVWYTLKNVQTSDPRVVTHLVFSEENYVCFHSIFTVCVCWPLSSPDGSYTEEQNSETQVKANINPTSTTPEFDDEFDDEEVLPTIGTCKALYPFEGNCNHKCCKQPESNTQTMED